MAFADLKNDFVFRRIFATHPEILRGLLNDLLDRRGAETIESLDYLPSEQLPIAEGAKLSILDVRCKDRAGTTFIVEMQLMHHPGFVNRVVYNACKAYVGQLKSGAPYPSLMDVVAISICDFELWPDAERDSQGVPAVPMLSRWNITEQVSKRPGMLQVQYAFLELPKVPAERPMTGGADLWAWLFVHAPSLTEVPADFAPGPFRDALELANQAKFSLEEQDAFERVRYEIWQVHAIAEARSEAARAEGKAEGMAEGEALGRAEGRRAALLAVAAARDLSVSAAASALIESCDDVVVLNGWIQAAVTAESLEDAMARPARPARPMG